MYECGTTREQLAEVAVMSRDEAVWHPNAHMKTPITVGDLVNSEPVAEP